MMRVFVLVLAVTGLLSRAAYAATRVAQADGRWTIENAAIRVTVVSNPGTIEVLDKRIRREWRQNPAAKRSHGFFTDVQAVRDGVRFSTVIYDWKGAKHSLSVTLSVPQNDPDLLIRADLADRREPMAETPFLEPLILDAPQGVLAVADYSNGHLYPLSERPFPREWFDGDRLDMPWLGLCDLESGAGYLLLLETSDDSIVTCRPDGAAPPAPQVVWRPSKGVFGYERRMRYHFASTGGYVALAKSYRAYAKQQGLIVPFAQKVKRNPNIAQLFGAPDVWGNATLAFVREAKAAGVEKMLIHGSTSPADMKAVRDLGYITSDYDNYTDIQPLEPGKGVDSSHDRLPEAAVQMADGQRMKAWLTFDKKTQFMKRCPALWLAAAKEVIPKTIARLPFVGRFIDVTTAEALYECYDPAHPLTRGDKRKKGEELLAYVNSLGLVTGGEHGIWWGVPFEDYVEGMMSTSYYSWPAGHLIHPKTKEEQFTYPGGGKTEPWSQYAKWGIGHEWRAPLWELVFHDCVVTTWYWGDASDFLLDAAPEVTPKKDAYNVLYGTIPLLWADGGGSWKKDKSVFLRTYTTTCKWHEVVAGREMLSHEFLTPDHAVQRTRFAGGCTAVVNFGSQPYTLRAGKRTLILPENGVWASGPGFEVSRAVEDGKVVLRIRSKSGNYVEQQLYEQTIRH